MATTGADRTVTLRHAMRLEVATIAWNIVEGVVAIIAALAAGSVALLGFGIDSFIESISAGVLVWRLQAEHGQQYPESRIAQLDERAHKLVGGSLFLLAAYVAVEALSSIYRREHPAVSFVGIAVTLVSIVVMRRLARSKREAARVLGSRALEADAFQTTACWWLSLIVLAGIALNAVFGWWWADQVAALGMTWFLVREGREAWNNEDCCP